MITLQIQGVAAESECGVGVSPPYRAVLTVLWKHQAVAGLQMGKSMFNSSTAYWKRSSRSKYHSVKSSYSQLSALSLVNYIQHSHIYWLQNPPPSHSSSSIILSISFYFRCKPVRGNGSEYLTALINTKFLCNMKKTINWVKKVNEINLLLTICW